MRNKETMEGKEYIEVTVSYEDGTEETTELDINQAAELIQGLFEVIEAQTEEISVLTEELDFKETIYQTIIKPSN